MCFSFVFFFLVLVCFKQFAQATGGSKFPGGMLAARLQQQAATLGQSVQGAFAGKSAAPLMPAPGAATGAATGGGGAGGGAGAGGGGALQRGGFGGGGGGSGVAGRREMLLACRDWKTFEEATEALFRCMGGQR